VTRVQELFDLSDRVAVLTGVGSGIGQATASLLAAAGATIVGGDIDEAAAQATADEIKADGGTAMVRRTDVTRRADVDALVDLAALGGGVVSFLSPCVLPLVPGYLSIVTGVDIAVLEGGAGAHTKRVIATTALFIAGFGSVFVALGLTAARIGQPLRDHQETLTRISGALMLAMALFLLGSIYLRAPLLYQEKRFHPELGKYGAALPLVAGAAFGFGWSPCIGPILGSILGIAATQQRVWAGATLLAAYSIGLGLPFLISGIALQRVSGAMGWVKRHFPAIVIGSSLILAGFGLLLMFDQLSRLTVDLQHALTDAHLDWLVNLG